MQVTGQKFAHRSSRFLNFLLTTSPCWQHHRQGRVDSVQLGQMYCASVQSCASCSCVIFNHKIEFRQIRKHSFPPELTSHQRRDCKEGQTTQEAHNQQVKRARLALYDEVYEWSPDEVSKGFLDESFPSIQPPRPSSRAHSSQDNPLLNLSQPSSREHISLDNPIQARTDRQ